MKRKITSLVALVLSMLMATPMLADQQSLVGIKTDATGSYVTTTQPATNPFYVIQGNAQHDNIVSWLFDDNGTFAATADSEVPTGPEALKYVWTFEKTDEGYAAKNYVTGSYIYIEGTSSGGKIKMTSTAPAYFTIDVDEASGYVAFMNASGQCIDMGYSGVGPVSWAGGATGSRRLTIFEADVQNISDLAAAMDRLNNCWKTYEQYEPDWGTSSFDIGSDIGQYNISQEEYNKFLNNLVLAHKILDEEVEGYTVEMIEALIKEIEDGYAAIVASLVKLTIADGNYRIVSAMEWTSTERKETGEYDENDQPIYVETTTHPLKAMYATLEGKAMWANIDSTDCRYLWNLTNDPTAATGLIKMMNIATDGILATCSQSAQATLDKDSQTLMTFQFIERRDDGKVVVVMKPSTGGSYAFLHCNGHGGGTGKGSNIVGWEAGAGASQWILEPVTDQEVAELVDAYAPIKNHELLVSMFQDLIAETEDAIAQAQDDQYISERSNGLITSTDQFSSPFTDPTEGSFANVLTEEPSTYWHSTWQEGDKQNHDHSFQIAFAEQPVGGTIQCRMIRRNVTNDHITNLGVFGTNDANVIESTTEDGWTNIGSFDLSKNASSGLEVYSNGLTLPEAYKYFRFYIDGTTTGRGYGHFAYFNLYNLTIDGNTQWSKLGKDAEDIEKALAVANAVDLDELSIDDYNTLKAALDKFKPLLVDLSALAAAINANKDVANLIAIGENPGFWSEESETSEFAATLSEATAYLKGGVYTQDGIDAYTEAILSSANDIFAAANPVEPGKWYAIKFDTEENYDAHGWNKAGAKNETLGNLFNNYAAPASIEEDELVGFSSLEDVTIGQTVRFINEDIIEEMDQVAFRFVAQGDTAFVIQHKSGLYLNGTARSTNLTLGLMPALFNVKAVGYGKVIIEARDLKGQGYYADAPVYLHAQNSGHSLVTWNNDAVDSSSAFYIEPIEDFDEGDEVLESVVMNVRSNSIQFMCYPTAFSVENAEIYAYQGAIPANVVGANLAHYAFNKVEQANPGQPVLLVVGDPEEFGNAPTEEFEPINITPVGTKFEAVPNTTGGVHGTYAYEWVDEGTVVVGGGKFGQAGNTLVLAEGAENTDCTRDVSANTGYIVYGENVLKDANPDNYDLIITTGRPNIVGDLNGDDKVDIADAVTVLNIMAAGNYNAEADLNKDQKIDIADFVTVLNIMAAQ